ncbi:alpha/beta hydrolase fold domain-containing protein [Pseudomonas sp. JAI111]|uniref:alpha/beta hydrolase fold domain-containing protein n=1 Tax=Pseudomonas sp. JAI111 TaxID=2735913 RepID=UPI00386209B6
MKRYWNQYLPQDSLRSHPDVSPLRAETFANLPATFIATAGFDTQRDQGQAYAARLVEAGIDVTFKHSL